MKRTPQLDLEQFASVAAHIAHFSAHGVREVLRQLRVAHAAWRVDSDHWHRRLGAEIDDDTAPLSDAFAVAFGRIRSGLAEEEPELSSVEPFVAGSLDVAALETTLPAGPGHAGAPLPFVAVPTTPVSTFTRPTKSTSHGSEEAPPAGGQTLEAVAVHHETLPFETQVAAIDSASEVRRYARYAARLAHDPGDSEAIRAEFGVRDEAAHALLTDHWNERFEANDGLRAEFELARDIHDGWLRMQRP